MKKIDALETFDAWLEDIEEDLILEEFYGSGRTNSTRDKRLEDLKDIRDMLVLSDSPFDLMNSLVYDFAYQARVATDWRDFPRTESLIRTLLLKLLKGVEWE